MICPESREICDCLTGPVKVTVSDIERTETNGRRVGHIISRRFTEDACPNKVIDDIGNHDLVRDFTGITQDLVDMPTSQEPRKILQISGL